MLGRSKTNFAFKFYLLSTVSVGRLGAKLIWLYNTSLHSVYRGLEFASFRIQYSDMEFLRGCIEHENMRTMHSLVFWWEVCYAVIDVSPDTLNAWEIGKPNLGWGCFTSARRSRSSRQTRGVCIAVFHVADHTCSRTLGCRYLEYRFPLSYLVSLQGEGNSFKTLGSWSLLGS